MMFAWCVYSVLKKRKTGRKTLVQVKYAQYGPIFFVCNKTFQVFQSLLNKIKFDFLLSPGSLMALELNYFRPMADITRRPPGQMYFATNLGIMA